MIKVPEDWLTGSKPLSEDREKISLGLVSLAIKIADKTVENNRFQKFLEDKDKVGTGRNRIVLELVIFNLYVISQWVVGNLKANPKEILDRVYFHFRKSISDNDLEFGMLVEKRSLKYNEAFGNSSGLGPAYWFGKTASEYVLGKAYLDPDPRRSSWAFFNTLSLQVANGANSLMDSRN